MNIDSVFRSVRRTLAAAAMLSLGTLFTAPLHAQERDGVVRLSEPVESAGGYEIFGASMPVNEAQYPISEAIAMFDEVAGRTATFTGTITEVCQVKGCWMIVSDGDQSARVTFKEYSFFVPSNSAGKNVRFSGILREVELTEDEARHYADDARPGSGAAISGPRKEYSVEASAVQIFTR